MNNTTPLPTLPVYQTLTETIQEAHNHGERARSLLNQLSIVLEGMEPDSLEELTIAVIEIAVEAISDANIGMEKVLDSLELKGGAR